MSKRPAQNALFTNESLTMRGSECAIGGRTEENERLVFMYRHLSMNEILTLRNVDAGFVVRGMLQSLAQVIAMVMFGNRKTEKPEPDAPGEGATGATEVIFTEIAVGMKYTVMLIWVILCVWEHFHTEYKVHTDHVLSGEQKIVWEGGMKGAACMGRIKSEFEGDCKRD